MKTLSLRSTLPLATLGALFVLILGFLVRHSTADLPLTHELNSLHHGATGAIANFIYAGLEPFYSLTFCAIGAAIYIVRHRSLNALVTFFGAVGFGWIPVVFIKELFQRPRPLPESLPFPTPVSPMDWSFPQAIPHS